MRARVTAKSTTKWRARVGVASCAAVVAGAFIGGASYPRSLERGPSAAAEAAGSGVAAGRKPRAQEDESEPTHRNDAQALTQDEDPEKHRDHGVHVRDDGGPGRA